MKFDQLTKSAINHTLHCLLGCAIGEILGMVISTALDWSNFASIALAILLAFTFGYALTLRSILKTVDSFKDAIKPTLATDTVSITTMEIVDNLFILLVPGAISASLSSTLFWFSLIASLIVAFFFTVPVNRFMMSRSPHAHHH